MSEIYKSLKGFLDNNNLIYNYIWYFLNAKGLKIPINEYNTLDKEKCIKKMNIQNKKLNEVLKRPLNYKKSGKMIELNEGEYNSLVPCYSIYLKHIENIYVLDIDDKNIRKVDDLPLLEYNIFKDCHYTIGNTKGIHIYLKIIDMVKYKNQQKILKSIDGDLIKTNNIWENVNKEIYGSKEDLIKEFKWNDISMIFDKSKMNIEDEDIFSMSTEVLYFKKEVDNISEISDLTETNNDNRIELDLFNKYLKGLSEKRSNEYLYWTHVIWIIYNVSKVNKWSLKVRNEMIHNFSKRSSKYNECETDNFIENNIRDNGILGVGTLILWYKEDNKLMNSRIKDVNSKDYKEKILDIETLNKGSNDVAKFITSRLIKNLVYCNDQWILYNNKSRLWEITKKPDATIINIVQKEIDIGRECLLKMKNKLNKNNENDLKEIEILEDKERSYFYWYSKVTNKSYSSPLKDFLADYLKDNDFDKKLNNHINKIAFKNGIFDLETFEFRVGLEQEDYLTKTIGNDYIEPREEDVNLVKTNLKKICNWNDRHLDYYLSSLGYAFTGKSEKEQLFWYFRGQTAENGKSIIFETLEKIAGNYVLKGTSNMLDKGVDLKKEIPTWKGLRILWLNELSTKLKDEDLVKGTCDGTSIKYNRNYAIEAEKVDIDFKLFCVSNNSLNIKGDAGIQRRFKLCQFGSQFKDDFKYDDYENLQFMKNKNFGHDLENKYSNALLKLIFSYSNKYNKEGCLMPYPEEWKKEGDENMADNNKFEEWFRDNFEIDKDLKISKNDFEENMPIELRNIKLKDELRRMKITFEYDKNLTKGGNRGVYKGFDRKIYKSLYN